MANNRGMAILEFLGICAIMYLLIFCWPESHGAGGAHGSGPVALSVVATSEPYQLVVDDNQSVAQMVAAGNYRHEHHVREFAEAGFTIRGRGVRRVSARLITFNRAFTREEAVRETTSPGRRQAGVDECLAFGARHLTPGRNMEVACFRDVGHRPRIDGEWVPAVSTIHETLFGWFPRDIRNPYLMGPLDGPIDPETQVLVIEEPAP